MTKLEVEIISRETIKPSSPTPPHLKTFKFSLFDQMSSITYPPLILYYSKIPHNNSLQDPSAKLKTSLSEALTRFYPLAGRIKENQFMDCNDEGVLCLVAKVNCPLSQILKQPQLEVLGRFHPLPVTSTEPPEVALQLAVQINLFSCSGIAVGIGASHKIMDAATVGTFLKCWAAIARGKPLNNGYEFEGVDCKAPSLFPARESLPAHAPAWLGRSFSGDGKNRTRTRRFVFNAEAIVKLKAKAKSEAVPNPTSNQALSGFIWKCLATVSKGPSVFASAINLRQRLEPPLPNQTVGNIVWKAFSCYNPVKNELDLQGFVGLLKNSVSEIKSNYVQNLVGDEGFGVISEWLKWVENMYSRGNPVYEFSSLRNIGFNEVDFGWGKPVWISLCDLRECNNLVMLIESGRGDGIDAWVALDENEISVLENDPELLAFASVNPGISCLLHELDLN